MKEYFIHLFETPLGKYFYDVNMNKIVEISDELYYFLESGENLTKELQEQIEKLKKSGYLKNNRVEICKHPVTDYIDDYLNQRLSYLVLQVTQTCNLRCEYCVYSGGYKTRTHSKKHMTYEIATKAIDFFIEHSKDEEILYFGFYGGEPLIEFEMIRKCVDYIKKASFGKKISFNLTTNATLLTEEIMDFFVQNDFHVVISLDGPKEIHDRSRHLMNSGSGSFDKIIENLKKFYLLYPQYYKKMVAFNAVLLPTYGINKIDCFFSENYLLKENAISASIVSDAYSKNEIEFRNTYITEERYKEFLILWSKLKKIRKFPKMKIAENIFGELKNFNESITFFERRKLPTEWQHAGPCIPGVKRLFVNVDGAFFPCEKVSEIQSENCMGNIKEGFNLETVERLLNVGKVNEKICKNCWIYSFCNVCIVNKSKVCKDDLFCSIQKENIEEKMITCKMLEKMGYSFEDEQFEEAE